MAVVPSTAPPDDTGPSTGPVRTCVGCRRRAPAATLLRVVAGSVAAGNEGHPPLVTAVPDPRRRMPGRGAWLHPDPACVDLAIRRRAFGRALRVPGPIDPAAVGEYVAKRKNTPPGGTPQEMKSNGHSMKRQQ